MGTSTPPQKGDGPPSPIFKPCLLRPNGYMDQDTTWHRGMARSRRHCVRLEPSSPHHKKGGVAPSHFRRISIVAKRLDGSRWHLARTWVLVQVTLCKIGSQLPSPKGGRAPPQFSAHFYCGQTAGCIKMPLGTEVGLGLSDILLDGDPAPPPLKGHSPQFSANVRCGQRAG